jgi:hypothetical protein
LVADVLVMSARELGAPVAGFILLESDDALLHRPSSYKFRGLLGGASPR